MTAQTALVVARAQASHYERNAIKYRGRVEAALAVHVKDGKRCAECGALYPCVTARILAGE